MKQQQTTIYKKSILTEDLQPQKDPIKKAAKDQFKSYTIYLNGANIFSYIFFTWVSPLLKYGNKCIIEDDDTPLLTKQLDAKIQYDNLTKTFYEATKSSIEGWTLIKSILKTFKWLYMKIFLMAFLLVCLMMYTPVLTDQIMQYVQKQTNRQIGMGIALFLIVFLTAFIKCIAQTHIFYHFGLVGFNLSNNLSMLIFSKALRYPILANKLYSSSNITNFSTTDAQKLTTISYQMTALLLMPLQFIIALFLMYYFIGVSFLSGIGIMILAIVVNFFLQRLALSLNQKLLKAKDERMKVTEQILNIIRFIKVNAIQKFFFKKLNKERQQQLKYIKNYNMFVVLMIFSYWLWPYAILSMTFATFIWLGNDITSHQAFTIIIIFKILQSPLKMLPTAISSAIQIWVSMKRVQKFLLTDQIKHDHIKRNEVQDKNKLYAIKIEQGDFIWGLQPQKQNGKLEKPQNQMKKVLNNSQSDSSLEESLLSQKKDIKPYIKAVSNISLQIPRDKFTMILGNIGSGKSSLLYSMLNQTQSINNSKIQINGSVAFVAQKAWIMPASLKQNIIVNQKFDENKFAEVIHYTALKEDIQIMKDGIHTKIGQKGINLSGGQKARVALARALYSNRSIYLLDDIISAVDVHVGKFLMEETIGKYLKNKTVVLSTHAISFAEYADQLIILSKGSIIKSGTYRQISQSKQFQDLSIKISQQDKERNKKLQEQNKTKKKSLIVQVITKQLEKQASNKQASNKMEKVVQELMLPQDRKKGEVQLQVYKHYIEMNGGIIFCIAILLSMSAWLTLILMSNIEIQHWCDNPSESSYHLISYVIFACSSSVFMAIKAIILVFSSFRVGKAAHKKMIKALLYTSISKFYNRVPIGRIINRLTKDLKQVDQIIGFVIGNCLNQIFQLLGNLIICVYASSIYILVPIIIVGYLCFRFKGYYMNTQRQCIRLQSITTSPIVSGFISTIQGLPTVRAFDLQQYFIDFQLTNINKNKRLRLTRQALQSWFSLRLTLLSFFINMSAIGFCILGPNNNPALAGLLLTYALTLNEDMINLVFGTSSVETRLVPFQRVMNFMQIQPQEGYKQYCQSWTPKQQGYNKQAFSQGGIQFKNFSTKYRQGSPLVLNDICVKIQKGQKVGIIGRTGAGKSTLAQCLLRILDASNGKITIDDKNIIDYNLKDLRSNITMIEQEPTLINTTIKKNLDPSGIYSDDQLMSMAKQCNLAEFIQQRGGLQTYIGNDSLSVGQKQLLCICRAFLKSSKIVLIDEATANIDMRNDRLIQEVIRKNFQQSTVLTIAHRLSTLQRSDKIMVLGGGKLLQWGAPEQLLRLPNGIYKQFCSKNAEEYLK